MATALKVYRWMVHGHPAVAPGTLHCVVAAKSKAEVGRLIGLDPRRLWNLAETRNAQDMDAALAWPGTVLYLTDRDWLTRTANYQPFPTTEEAR